jgi:hypothetical protein
MKTSCFIAVLFLIVPSPTISVADERQDVAQLGELTSKIERILPSGWEVAFELSKDRWRRERPLLIVRSRDKLPIERIGLVGRPSSSADPDPYIVREKLEIEFGFVPYVSPEDYEQVGAHNQEMERRRRQYEETRLGKRQSQYKGGISPSTLEMQTGMRSPEVLREYAFLWLRTEPRPAPTHRYRELSVTSSDLAPYITATVKIHDSQKDEEYRKIVNGLRKIFIAYDNESWE